MKDQTLTIQEAAKFLGVATKTLRRWDESGRLKPERTVGNQRRYSLSELEAFQQTKPQFPVISDPASEAPLPSHIAVAQEAVDLQAKNAVNEQPQFSGVVDAQVSKTEVKEEVSKPQPFGLGTVPMQSSLERKESNDNSNESKGIKIGFFSHPHYAMALAGALALLLLFFTFGFINAQNANDTDLAFQNKAVLAAGDKTPLIVLRVNVPSVFGKQATFLDSVNIQKGLTVGGVATLSGGVVTNNADINAGTGRLTASNVIYSLLAGSNISITGDPQNPTIAADFGSGLVSSFQGETGAVTLLQGSGIGLDGLTITNTGVLSVQGQTGSVTFTGGNGVSVSGTTINNTDPGSAQNIFKSIIAGSTTIDANSNNDSVTFAAGSGITITGNAGSKTVTITSNASGTLSGLTTNGVLYATDPNNASSTTAGTTGTVLKGVTAGAPIFGAVDLSADVTGLLAVNRGGTGLTTTPTNGQLLIGNGAGYSLGTITAGAGIGVSNGAGTISLTNNGVLSITGTANQITTSGSTGAITLSLPQDIATSSNPIFSSLSLTANTNQLTLGTGNTGVLTLSALSGNRTYTLPDASGEICLSIGNCPGGGGGTIGGSGTTNYLPRFTSATNLGNSLIYDTGTKIGIGTTSPQGLFSVVGGAAGQALVSLDETGDQNILVGSASGTTRFVFDRAGNLNINGGSYQIGGSNVLTSTTLGSSVTGSSLTSVSTLNAGSIASGFGSIDVGADSISGGDITATGSTGITITGNGAGLTFSGTGNHVINASSGVLQFGAATLTGAITGNNQNITGLSNLSAAGTITFSGLSTGVVKSNGSGVLSSSAVGLNTSDVTGILGPTNGGTGLNSYNAGDLIYASGSNTLAARAIGTNGQILTVSGGVPVWADAGGLINFWQRANGAISPLNITDDFLIGGTATSSARFQISGTTGDASTSGSITFRNGGSIQTTSNQSFTIGGSTTGNITLAPLNGNGVVTVNGDLNLASGKALQINGSSVLTASTLGSSVINSSLTSVGALTGGSIASGFGTITTTNTITGTTLNGTTGINTGASAGTQRIDASGNLVNIGNITASGTITFSGLSTNNGLLYTNGSGVVSQAAAGTSGQLLVANGSGVPTFVTLSSDATLAANGTLTIGADAVALGTDTTGNYVATLSSGNGISAAATGEGSTPTIALAALTADWNQTGGFDIVLGNASSELRIMESSGATYYGTIDVGDLTNNQTYTFPDASGTVCLLEAANCTGGASSSKWQRNGTVLAPLTASDQVVLGGNTTTDFQFEVNGYRVGKALVSFNQTGDQNILTASSSGVTKFNLTNTGNIEFAGNTSFLNTLTSVATANRTYTLPDADGTICLTTGNCAGVGGGLTGAGTSGQIAFFNGTGTLTSETSGFAWDATNNKLGIGNDTPTGKLDVTGANLGKALVIFNETGDQDILVGSASGTTRFVFDRTGNLNLNGGAYQIGGATVLSSTTLGSSVVSSSLTSVGALTGGSIASGFGTIATNNTITGTTINGTTGINTGAGAGTQRIDNNGNLSNIGTINASGALTFGNYTTNGGLLYTNGSGVVGQTGAGTSGQVLQSNAGGAPTWVDAATLGTNYWQRIAGTVSPLNITDDLLIGGTATSSAKFQVFANTGNATTSGNLTFNAASAIQTTRNQSLTIGGDTTGNITLSPLNGNGTVTSTGDLNLATGKGYQINGANVLTATALGSSVVSSSLTSVGALTGGSIGSGFGTIATSNTITGTTLNGTTGINTGAGAGILRIDNNGNLSNIGTIDSTYLDATGNNVNLAASTNLQFNGTTVINSSRELSNLTGLSTSLNPTAANTYALGTGTGNQFSTIYGQALYQNGNQVCDTSGNCSGLSVNYWDQANGVINPKNATLDFLVGGNATASAKFAVLNINSGIPTASVSAGTNGAAYLTAAGTLQTTANQTLTIGGNSTGNIILSPLGGSGTVTSTGDLNLASGKQFLINGASVLTSTALGTGVVSSSLTSVGALTGGSIGSGFGTIATANTITGTTVNGTTGINTGAGAGTLRIDNNGNLSNIGTINASGAITFSNLGAGIVKSTGGGLLSSSALNLASGTEVTGTLGAGNGGTGFNSYATGDLLVGNGSSTLSKLAIGTDGQILSIAGGTPSWISSSSINYWQRANGSLAPLNITDDLLIGGTATSSAKFHVYGLTGNASTSGTLTFDTVGNIQTTRNQALTIGGNATGNIALMPQNGAGMVGIGTTTPTNSLTIGDGGITINRTGGLDPNLVFSTSGTAQAQIRGATDGSLSFTNGNAGTTWGIFNSVGSFGLGTGSTPLARLDVRGNSGTTPVASFSGNTSRAAMLVDNNGVGDLFTASKSGATKFVIANNGNVGIGTPTPNSALSIVNPIAAQTGLTIRANASQSTNTFVIEDSGGTPQFTIDQYGGIYGSNGLTIDRYAGIGTGGSSGTQLRIQTITVNDVGFDTTGMNGQIANLANFNPVFGYTGAWFDESANLRIGNGAPDTGKLNVTGAYTGKALAIFNEIGNQDIFTASSAGTTRFTIANNGTLTASAYTTAGGLLYTNGTGTVAQTGAGTSGQCLFGGATPSWGTCAVGTNYWNVSNGALSPVNNTLDLLIGGTASSSAKFAFLNANSGTPTASISANSGGNATYLTGDGTLSTTLNRTLSLNPNGGNVGIGTTNATQKLTVNGRIRTDGGMVFNQGLAPTANFIYVGGDTAGATDQQFGFVLAGVGSTTAAQGGYFVGRGNNFSDISNQKGNMYFAAGNPGGAGALEGSLNFLTGNEVNRMMITNAGTIGVGTTSPLATLDVRGQVGTNPIASFSGSTSRAGLIVDNSGTGDLFSASSSGLNRFVVKQDGNVGIGTATPNSKLEVAGQVRTSGASGGYRLEAQDNGGSFYTLYSASGELTFYGGLNVRAILTASGLFGLGTNVYDPQAQMDIRSTLGTQPIASLSGTTSRAGFVVDNNGVGDLFTASKSGATKFTILNNGNISMNNYNNCGMLTTVGTVLTCSSAPAGSTNYWNLANGTLAPVNTTLDLLVGGTSSSSAKFAVLNVNSGTPTASISATGTGNGLALAGDGTIQSLRKNTLTLGGSTTGDILFKPNNSSSSLYLGSNGSVGLGTTDTSAGKFTVSGTYTDPADGYAGLAISPTFSQTTNSSKVFRGNFLQALYGDSYNLGELNGSTNFASFYGSGSLTTLRGSYSQAGVSLGAAGNVSYAQGSVGDVQHYGTGTMSEATGLTGIVSLRASGTGNDGEITTARGVYGYVENNLSANTGTIVTGTAIYAGAPTAAANAPITNTNGVYVENQGKTGVTNATGLYVAAQSGASSTNYAAIFAGGRIGMGTTTPLSGLDVRGSGLAAGTVPVASISGQTSNAALIVDNNGVGDLFTASKSGATKFAVLNNGDVRIANLSTAGGVLYTNGTGTIAQTAQGASGQCLQSQGVGGAPIWGSCDSASSVDAFTVANGLIYNGNQTTDFAFGGTSSASAKFKVSISGTQPTASVAGQTSSAAMIVDQTGVGDLFTASKSGATKFTITNSGVVGIGQFPRTNLSTTPAGTLHLWGLGSNGSNAILNFGDQANSSNAYIKENGTGDSDILELGGRQGLIFATGTNTTYGFERMRIDANGNVNINNTGTALSTLDARGNSGTTSVASVSGQTSNAALIVDNNGVGDVFTASKSGKTFFTVKNNGVIQMGNNTDGVTFDYLNGGPNYVGRARPTKQIVLSPEYAGGIMTASGSATTDGDMTADASASASTLITLNGVANNYLTYYEWSSSETSFQDYTVGVRVTLPPDFSSWAPGGSSIQVVYNTELGTSTSNKLDMIIYPSSSSTPTVYRQTQNSASKTWTTIDVPATDLNDGTPWNAASQSAMLYFKMSSKDGNHVQLGDIILNYLSKF